MRIPFLRIASYFRLPNLRGGTSKRRLSFLIRLPVLPGFRLNSTQKAQIFSHESREKMWARDSLSSLMELPFQFLSFNKKSREETQKKPDNLPPKTQSS